ncbi:MAG: type II toxin-antitoxin system RelE/ParE family toxin [Nitrosospira sp.]|nr:type II toxin-antitoxin system RelE/ParE family toxin [Nitrosospira sp.]
MWLYTRRQWSRPQPDRYIDMLSAAYTELADSPMTASVCDPIRPGYRRYHVERHMIYFRIAPYGITVIRILHDRMEASRHLGL